MNEELTEEKKQVMDYRPAWYEQAILEKTYETHRTDPDGDRSMEMLFGALVAVCAIVAGAFIWALA